MSDDQTESPANPSKKKEDTINKSFNQDSAKRVGTNPLLFKEKSGFESKGEGEVSSNSAGKGSTGKKSEQPGVERSGKDTSATKN